MTSGSRFVLSRRNALLGLTAVAAYGSGDARTIAQQSLRPARPDEVPGPTFDRGGPNAEHYGADVDYPVPNYPVSVWEGNPWRPKYRVGAFSHLDEIYATRTVSRAAAPWAFRRVAMELSYRFQGRPSSLTEYLSRNPVTGLLIAKDNEILFEHYQYARTDSDRLVSQSMVKSIAGILVGIAVADGAIKSVDDRADVYVPGLKGTEYGRTPIRDLLHMSSGIEFSDEKDNGHDLKRLWRDMVAGSWIFRKGTVASIAQFNHRIAPAGTQYVYASIEPDVLGLVVRNAVGRSLSEYLQDKVWQPIGAEADARWLVDADGFELPHFGFNAVLRDYARLGRLLAHDGAWEGRQLVPAQWMIEATTVRPSDAYLAPGNAMPTFGYGYLVWLIPGKTRQFAMVGAFGQRVCVDTASKLVMVQTALEDTPESWHLWSALVEQFH